VILTAANVAEFHAWRNERRRLRDRLLAHQKGLCIYCDVAMTGVRRPGSEDPNSVTFDHIIPRGRGGSDTPMNLALACYRCNVAKADMTPEEFELALRFGLA
jgi:5-methylcytosine-specific restriction endonuclease McrA